MATAIEAITADNFSLVSVRIQDMLTIIADRVFPKGDGGRDITAKEKNKGDFVTVKDVMVDQMLSGFLEKQFGCPVVSEERQHSWPPPERRYWVIDPVDGTHNLAAGWPIFGIMGAYVVEAVPVYGFIYFPYAYGGRREMYFAGLGCGAWVDDGVFLERIFVDPAAKLEDSFVLFEGPSRLMQREMSNIGPHAGGYRVNLCCAVSFVSLARDRGRARRTAGVVSLNNKPWDNLPAAPIIIEAGGIISDTYKQPITVNNATNVVAANNIENYQALLGLAQEKNTEREVPRFSRRFKVHGIKGI
ncbi:MAG: inositol monophosphatase family protein [Candidatus Sungbacteria bacterium]|nr:inositol monophosphatase family protein [Candidatus Sungbacteria bacterium]